MIGVRAANPGDADAIAAIYVPHVLDGIATFETEPPDAAAMRERMAAGRGLYPWLVALDAADTVVGYAYAGPFHPRAAYRWTVETSVYVAEGAGGAGIGRALYAALLAGLTEQGFTQAIARIAVPNPGSIALHAAAGFVRAGTLPATGRKHGRWIDVELWQAALAESTGPCAEPRPRA